MKRGLIIFFIVLALIIGVPFLAGLKKQFMGNTAPSTSANTSQNPPSPSNSLPTNPTPIVPSPSAPPVPPPPPVVPQGPPDFTGTAWNVPTPYGIVQVSLNPGGQAVASHPMVGTIAGTWRMQGNRIVATVSFMGQTHTVSADICGNTLCYNGQPLQRVR